MDHQRNGLELMAAVTQACLLALGASIGVPLSIGNTLTAGNTSAITITTTANIIGGDLVVVAVEVPSNALITVSSVSDGTNTYALAKAINDGANFDLEIWYKTGATAVASGATITITLSGATTGANGFAAQAVTVKGITGNVDGNASQSVSSASPTVTTGALAQPKEIAFGLTYRVSGAATYTEASGFTNLVTTGLLSGAAGRAAFSYQIVSATTAVTYAPSWSTSAADLTLIATFKGL